MADESETKTRSKTQIPPYTNSVSNRSNTTPSGNHACCTWLIVPQEELDRFPLADAVFHVIMMYIICTVRDVLHHNDENWWADCQTMALMSTMAWTRPTCGQLSGDWFTDTARVYSFESREPRFVPSKAWPRPGLAEPQSASIAGFGSTVPLSSTQQKGKDCHDQYKQVHRASFGFVFALQINMSIGDGVGPPLFEAAYCQLSVALCDVDAFRAAEEGAWVGVKPDLQRRHRFGPACKGNVF